MDYLPSYQEVGDGPLLVFLHGIGGNRFSFDGQLPAFRDRWRCVAWDMPGYGGSPLPAEDLSFELMSNALANLLDHLDAPEATLIGHSMGGFVAQDFVARNPGRVRALVLSATSPAFGKPGGDWQQQFLNARLAPLEEGKTPADFAVELVTSMFADPARSAEIAAAVRSMSALPSDSYRAALKCIVTFDRRDALAEISCPTLLLAAELDETAPAKVMQRMADKIPDARYECLEALGHLANVEDPRRFNHAVMEFLESLPQ
jgi:pimeloyl-ACP methyl ester carboxylesterase